MVYTPHEPVKDEKIAQLGAAFLEQELTLPKLFQRKGFDEYVGAEDDKVNVKVDGVLPYRLYGFRNDRAQPIQFDVYREKKIQVGFTADVPYSAVKLTDEQAKLDLDGWTKLARKQGEAIGRGINHAAADYISGAGSRTANGGTDFDYSVKIGVPEYDIRWGFNKAKTVLDRLMVPGARQVTVGSDWAEAIANDPKITFAEIVGDSVAEGALREATLGRLSGFEFVVDYTIDPKKAFAFVPSAFIHLIAAPAVPDSVPAGALGNSEGVPVRWIRDYDTERFVDRSVFNNWNGFQPVTDMLAGYDPATKQGIVGEYQHFIRGIELSLESTETAAQAATVVPTVTSGSSDAAKAATELATLTGIKPWTVRTYDEANPALRVVNTEPAGP